MVFCGLELGLLELCCMRNHCWFFAKVAIVLTVLVCDLLVVVWVASGLVVVMGGILVVGSLLAGLAGLPLALGQGYRLGQGEIGYRSRCVKDVMCAVEDLIDDGFWRLVGTYV